jgi:acylphosphatase
MKRTHVYVSGRVQGVFFRAETKRAAMNLSLTGWVRNRIDGRVEAVFEGDDADVDKMIEWCRIGPSAARVQDVSAADEVYTGSFSSFTIKD